MPQNLISTDEFCTHYKVEYSFINSLQKHGLIKIIIIDKTPFIDNDHLHQLEKLVRMHYDLEINLEGIEAITYLLERVSAMQNEIASLKNRIWLYENENIRSLKRRK